MKITIEIDLIPEDVRCVLGLPDLAPFQPGVLDQMDVRLSRYLNSIWQDSLWLAAPSMRGDHKPADNK